MEVPLNSLHYYLGFPILLGLGIDSIRRYHKNRNTTSLYIGMACTLAGIALAAFGLPVLFTHNPKELSLGTMIGDISMAIAMMYLWFICIRAFLGSRKNLVLTANITAIVLMVLVSFGSIMANLFEPYGTQITHNPEGGISLTYTEHMDFVILSGINSISLLLIALFFWRQGSAAPTKGQSIRIRSIAVGFILAIGPFITASFLPSSVQTIFGVIMWTMAVLALAIMNMIGAAISKKQNAVTDQNTTINAEQQGDTQDNLPEA